MPAYWILKSEPETFSWATLVADGSTQWDGVRNHQAKNFLKAMAVGDIALFYHSVSDRALVGLCQITQAHYPDPTDPKWLAVEVKPLRPLARPISLAEFKADPDLSQTALVRQSRLSVIPLSPAAYERILVLESQGTKVDG
jgi:predicted RNA-binding protein with PUA-like domain